MPLTTQSAPNVLRKPIIVEAFVPPWLSKHGEHVLLLESSPDRVRVCRACQQDLYVRLDFAVLR